MTRFSASLDLAALVISAAALSACGSEANAPAPPTGVANVLLFTVDTLRADALGCYGAEDAGGASPTPALDALAAESLLFERAFSQATLTNPALTSMLTGLLPPQHGVEAQNSGFAPNIIPLAVLCQAAGIRTGSFIANMCKLQDTPSTVYHDGWDERFCGMLDDPDNYEDQYLWDAAVVDAGLRWIAEQDGAWFAWIHLMDPHAEHRPPAPLWDWDADPPLEKYEQYRYYNEFEERRQMPPDDVKARLFELYAAEVRGADQQLARALAALDAGGQAADTAVIFSADHGEELFETWVRFDHGFSMTEGVFHVPLTIRAPGVKAARNDAPVELSQVTPTILDLLGLDVPYALPAPSLLSAAPSRGYAFSFGGNITTSVRTRDHRYWQRHTAEPFTREFAAWRTEAPWFQERELLATYDAERGWAPTWIDVDTTRGRREADRLARTLTEFRESLDDYGKGFEIDDPELQRSLTALGYLDYTEGESEDG